MAKETKNQHFLPKMYIKRFTYDGLFRDLPAAHDPVPQGRGEARPPVQADDQRAAVDLSINKALN